MTTKRKALEEVVFNDTKLIKNKTPTNWIENEKLQLFFLKMLSIILNNNIF